MRKMKNYLKFVTLFIGASILLWNCQKDDTLINEIEQDLITKKDLKEKIEQKTHKTFDYKTFLDWKKSFNFNGITYVPIKENIKLFDFLRIDKVKKKAKIFSFLTIKLEDDNSQTTQIRLFIDFKERNNIDNKALLELNYIVLSENLDFIESSFKRKESKKGVLSKNDCQLWGVYRVTTYANGDIEEELLYTYEVCDGAPIDEEQADDSDGGGDSDGGDEVESPDCESFDYSRIGATNWQCAAVKGVWDVYTVINWDCAGIGANYASQPLYFQLPINSNFGENTGNTKTESAVLLEEAFDAFGYWMNSNPCGSTTEAQRNSKFLELIKSEFEDRGGNVTLTPPLGFTGTPSDYKYSLTGYGDCN